MNQDHVEIVNQGADAITQWRDENPDERLNLMGADLRGVDLRVANLSGANLSEADFRESCLISADLSSATLYKTKLVHTNLTGAKLRKTYLASADLWYAQLVGADLREADFGADASFEQDRYRYPDYYTEPVDTANLSGANLSRAILTGVNLGRIDLRETNLTGAVLGSASLREAIFGETVLCGVDLSETNGLHESQHSGPSYVDFTTLSLSRGRIPEKFLQDCGVSEDLITYIPSLVGQPFQHYSAFISYSHTDESFAKRLHSRMRDEKLRVWYAPEDMKGGRKMYRQIDEAIRTHDKLLLVLSEQSMDSNWVATEIRRARRAEQLDDRQKLFPIRLCSMDAIREWECFDADSGQDLAVEVREYHIPDFSNWMDHDALETAFGKLLIDLRESEEEAGPARQRGAAGDAD